VPWLLALAPPYSPRAHRRPTDGLGFFIERSARERAQTWAQQPGAERDETGLSARS